MVREKFSSGLERVKNGADDVISKLRSAEEFSEELVPANEGELGEIQKRVTEEYQEDFDLSWKKTKLLGNMLTEQEESRARRKRTKWNLSDQEFEVFLELFLKLAYAEGRLYVNEAEDELERAEEKIEDVETAIGRGDPEAMQINMQEAMDKIKGSKKKVQDSAKEFKAIIFVIEEFDSYSFSQQKEEKAREELEGVRELNEEVVDIYEEWEEVGEAVENAIQNNS